MGHRPQRTSTSETAHLAEEVSQLSQTRRRMVQEESPSPGGGTVQTAECQASWLLQLLRSARQLGQPERVLSAGAEATSQGADRTHHARECYPGRLTGA